MNPPVRKYITLCFLVLMALASCRTGDADRENFPLDAVALNEVSLLDDALFFRDKEAILAINSLGELDVVIRASAGQVGITLHNTGKERLDVSGLSLHSKAGLYFRQPPDTSSMSWSWQVPDGDPGKLTLALGKSSLVLLPEEQLHLPALSLTPKQPRP